MPRKLLAGAAAVLLVGIAAASVPAHAQQERREAELARLHALCNQNYRPACIRFGIMLGEARERHEEWRRAHPDWWWWERY